MLKHFWQFCRGENGLYEYDEVSNSRDIGLKGMNDGKMDGIAKKQRVVLRVTF